MKKLDWSALYKTLEERYGEEPEHKLMEYRDLIVEGKVLDLGVGGGRNALFLAELGHEVIGVDISEKKIEDLQKLAGDLGIDVQTITQDLRDLIIEENSYSLIIASWVLNFFKPSEVRFIAPKIVNGLKPGGMVYFGAFSTVDPKYQLDKKRLAEVEPNTFFYDKWNSYGHYYTLDEVRDLFDGLEVISCKEGVSLELDGNEQHFHGSIEYIARKMW